MVLKDFIMIPTDTESAGTVIVQMVQPQADYHKMSISRLTITAVTTAQTLYVMKVLGRTTLSAAAAASQKVVNITADPGSIAANDYLAIQNDDGTWFYDIVASVSTLAITMTTNVATALASGNRVLFYGVHTDGHETAAVPAGENTWEDDVAYWASNHGEPIILYLTNATNAATVNGGIAKLWAG